MSCSSFGSRQVPSMTSVKQERHRKVTMLHTGDYAGLVAELQSSIASRQKQAAGGVLEASSSRYNGDAILEADVVPLLVPLLRSNQPAMQEPAACSLGSRATDCQHKDEDAIFAAAVEALDICDADSMDGKKKKEGERKKKKEHG